MNCIFGGRKIDKEVAMIPRAWITKRWCSWDDDLADSLPSRLSVVRNNLQREEQYAHAVALEKLTDIAVNSVVIWHARQSSYK